MPRDAHTTYRFGDFLLNPSRRSLLRGAEPVRLSARGFDLLTALVERSGEVVSKQDLFQLVWPRGFVEESNLRVQMAALRRALDDPPETPRFIANVPGRGYSFVAPVDTQAPDAPPPSPRLNLPAGMPAAARRRSLVGRDDFLDALVDTLATERLVTLTGTGGLGKTAVALAAAERLADRFRDGVLVVDLAPLAGGELVVAHLASLLRVPAASTSPVAAVSEHLLERQMLIVLDNCEHVVGAVCALAEQVALNCPQIRLLATSREALHAQGEVIRRLAPLPTPQASAGITACDAMTYASVQLMMERTRSHDESLRITDQNAGLVCDICISLDGLPLAIELAATRVPVFGFDGLASLLAHRLRMLVGHERDAEGRHRTLGATIDWSYDWLAREEQALLRALSAFAGPFSLAAAQALAQAQGFDTLAGAQWLAQLVEKSLIATDHADGRTRYRLFESIRLYAAERLAESAPAEQDAVHRAHAQFFFNEQAAIGADSWVELPDEAWLHQHAEEVADMRAALEWAFGPRGDAQLAVRLAVASAPTWFKILLVPELRANLERALATSREIGLHDDLLLLRLHVALGHSIFHTLGPVQAVGDVLWRALEHARALGDTAAQLSVLWALFGNYSTFGDYPRMMECVDQVATLAAHTQHPAAGPLLERISALGLHLSGRQPEALRHARAALAPPSIRGGEAHGRTLVYDHRTASSSHTARVLWLSGFADQAAELVASTSASAQRIDQPFALGYFLVFGACPVSIWRGDHTGTRCFADMLLDVAAGISFNVWRVNGKLFSQVLDVLEGDEARRSLALGEIRGNTALTPYQQELLASFDGEMVGEQSLQAAIERAPHWASAEQMRALGECHLVHGGRQAQAQALFQRALELSRQQGALSWELRIALSLARLWHAQERNAEARAVLGQVYPRFTEGFGTRDLRAARQLLERIS